MNNINHRESGITLIEVMLATLILGILVLSIITSFSNITVGNLLNRSRTFVTMLAQEKIEVLKNVDYYQILVTTPPYNTTYDRSYYPPEKFTFGNMEFERRTLIEKVEEQPSGALEVIPWNTIPDAGLKKITISVVWQERGNEKTFTIINLRRNPDYVLTGKIEGTVKDKLSNAPIEDALVYLQSMPVYDTYTDAAGFYSLTVPTGFDKIVADKVEYFITRVTFTITGTHTVNFLLSKKSTGAVQGLLWKRDHLVISEVCSEFANQATGDVGNLREYVELYNPTTYPITINDTNFKLKCIDNNDLVSTVTVGWINNTVSSGCFFLFGSTRTLRPTGMASSVVANATYTATGIISKDWQWGVAITNQFDVAIDSLAWGNAGLGKAPPSNGREGSGYEISGGFNLPAETSLERKAYPPATANNMWTGGIYVSSGNAFDTDENMDDFVYQTANRLNPQSSLTLEAPAGGTPAAGATVFADDELSSMVTSATGYYYLTNISTGAWTIEVSSGILVGQTTAPLSISAGSTISRDIVLSSVSTNGYIMGKLLRANLSPAPTLSVTGGGNTVNSKSDGLFFLPVSTGTVTVIINQGPALPNYIEKVMPPEDVEVGEKISLGDIIIYYNGGFSGRVKTLSGDGIENNVVIAIDTSTWQERATTYTSSTGSYSLTNLGTAMTKVYKIYPLLSSGETSTPEYYMQTFNAGDYFYNKDFVISGAYGKIYGSVTESGVAIKTGVLIIATTSTIAVDPPAIDYSFRCGSNVYYCTTGDQNGTYSIDVPGPSGAGTITYNVYAWYSKVDETTATTVRKNGSQAVSADGSYNLNFSWH